MAFRASTKKNTAIPMMIIPQYSIEEPCPVASYIPDNGLCVARCKEPVPVQQ